MKKLLKLTLLAFVAVVCFSVLTACGGEGDGGDAGNNPNEITVDVTFDFNGGTPTNATNQPSTTAATDPACGHLVQVKKVLASNSNGGGVYEGKVMDDRTLDEDDAKNPLDTFSATEFDQVSVPVRTGYTFNGWALKIKEHTGPVLIYDADDQHTFRYDPATSRFTLEDDAQQLATLEYSAQWTKDSDGGDGDGDDDIVEGKRFIYFIEDNEDFDTGDGDYFADPEHYQWPTPTDGIFSPFTNTGTTTPITQPTPALLANPSTTLSEPQGGTMAGVAYEFAYWTLDPVLTQQNLVPVDFFATHPNATCGDVINYVAQNGFIIPNQPCLFAVYRKVEGAAQEPIVEFWTDINGAHQGVWIDDVNYPHQDTKYDMASLLSPHLTDDEITYRVEVVGHNLAAWLAEGGYAPDNAEGIEVQVNQVSVWSSNLGAPDYFDSGTFTAKTGDQIMFIMHGNGSIDISIFVD